LCYYIICTYFFFLSFSLVVSFAWEKNIHIQYIYDIAVIYITNMFIIYTQHTTSCAYINCGLLGFGDLRIYIYIYIYCTTTVIDTKCAIIQSRLLRPNVKVTAGPVCLGSRAFSNNKNRLHLSKTCRSRYTRPGDNDRYIERTHIYLA